MSPDEIDAWNAAIRTAISQEREACALLAEVKIKRDWDGIGVREEDLAGLSEEMGNAIRARGEA
jgi:hypothetical protein